MGKACLGLGDGELAVPPRVGVACKLEVGWFQWEDPAVLAGDALFPRDAEMRYGGTWIRSKDAWMRPGLVAAPNLLGVGADWPLCHLLCPSWCYGPSSETCTEVPHLQHAFLLPYPTGAHTPSPMSSQFLFLALHPMSGFRLFTTNNHLFLSMQP